MRAGSHRLLDNLDLLGQLASGAAEVCHYLGCFAPLLAGKLAVVGSGGVANADENRHDQQKMDYRTPHAKRLPMVFCLPSKHDTPL